MLVGGIGEGFGVNHSIRLGSLYYAGEWGGIKKNHRGSWDSVPALQSAGISETE